MQQDLPPAVALNDKLALATADDGNDELYDNFGNYVGDQSKFIFFKMFINIILNLYDMFIINHPWTDEQIWIELGTWIGHVRL